MRSSDLVPRIDWTPFFQTWELAGHYPDILDDPKVGPAATQSVRATRRSCSIGSSVIVSSRRGVSSASGRPIVKATTSLCITTPRRKRPLATVHTLRQQMRKPPGRPNLALADFVAPKETGVPDYVGAFAVTAGDGLDSLVTEFEAGPR